MNLILLIPVIYLVIETILGYRRGLIKSVLLLISWILSFGGSILLVREFAMKSSNIEQFAGFFEQFVGSELASMASLIFLFLILMVMIKIFCHIIIRFSGIISDIPVVGTINKILGAVFGLLKGGIAVFLVFLVYSVYNGAYMDILWKEIPQVMTVVEVLKQYLQQLWEIVA